MFCEEILLEALPKGFLPGEKKTMWNWPHASIKPGNPVFGKAATVRLNLGIASYIYIS
jgi:hypothetical protein